MIPHDYLDLIQKLYNKTISKRVDWKTTPNENEFSAQFSEFVLTVYKGVSSSPDNPFIRFNIVNNRGKVIDQFFINLIDDDGHMMENLYETARRKAYNIDQAIETIMRDLEDLEPFEEIH